MYFFFSFYFFLKSCTSIQRWGILKIYRYFDQLIDPALRFFSCIIRTCFIKKTVQLALSFVIFGLQQELAFKFSSVEFSDSIKIIQHILAIVTGIRLIIHLCCFNKLNAIPAKQKRDEKIGGHYILLKFYQIKRLHSFLQLYFACCFTI